jgi:hypothetical protein
MLDLDIGMQDWLCEPFAWDDSRRMDRGKIMTAADLDAGRDFGRYLDVDGDGIPYRTYPGTHPSKGSYFTRGTTKDRYARYTEEGVAYVDNMQRLLRKFDTAKALVPAPVIRKAAKPTRSGVIWFGSTGAAMAEALAALELDGIHVDQMRLRRLPVCRRRARIHRGARSHLPGRAEPRRPDEGAAGQRNAASIRRGSFRCCTTTARRSPPASSRARLPRRRACST